MRNKRILILVFLLVAVAFLGVYSSTESTQSEQVSSELLQQLNKVNLNKVNKLMVVAHPDDETIWGGQHLLEDDYLVVCLTNANNKQRKKEFFQVMQESNDIGIMLSYPDKVNNKRDDWSSSKEDIEKDIAYLLQYKKWDLIITHNPDGEYGHIHHKMTSRIVSGAVESRKEKDCLYYFGYYVKSKDMENEKSYLQHPLNEKQLANKQKLIEKYTSQKSVMKKLGHMFPYENWKSANDYKK